MLFSKGSAAVVSVPSALLVIEGLRGLKLADSLFTLDCMVGEQAVANVIARTLIIFGLFTFNFQNRL